MRWIRLPDGEIGYECDENEDGVFHRLHRRRGAMTWSGDWVAADLPAKVNAGENGLTLFVANRVTHAYGDSEVWINREEIVTRFNDDN